MQKEFKIVIVDDEEGSIHILIEDENAPKDDVIEDGIRRQEIISKTEYKYKEIKLNLDDLDVNTLNTFLIHYLTKNRNA